MRFDYRAPGASVREGLSPAEHGIAGMSQGRPGAKESAQKEHASEVSKRPGRGKVRVQDVSGAIGVTGQTDVARSLDATKTAMSEQRCCRANLRARKERRDLRRKCGNNARRRKRIAGTKNQSAEAKTLPGPEREINGGRN